VIWILSQQSTYLRSPDPDDDIASTRAVSDSDEDNTFFGESNHSTALISIAFRPTSKRFGSLEFSPASVKVFGNWPSRATTKKLLSIHFMTAASTLSAPSLALREPTSFHINSFVPSLPTALFCTQPPCIRYEACSLQTRIPANMWALPQCLPIGLTRRSQAKRPATSNRHN
jgi:hypothetical protein